MKGPAIHAVTTPGASPMRTRKGTPRSFRKATVRTRPSRRTTTGASNVANAVTIEPAPKMRPIAAFEALPPAPDVDRLPALVDQVDRDGGEQHDRQDDDEARAQRSRLLGAEAEKRPQDQRQEAGEQIAEARRADGQEPADAEEVNALVGPALLDHERRADDGVAALEQSLNGREHEQRRRF